MTLGPVGRTGLLAGLDLDGCCCFSSMVLEAVLLTLVIAGLLVLVV